MYITALDTYRAEMGRCPRITPQQEQTASRDQLITSNLRLVMKIAAGFANRGVSVEDLVSAGNLGLIQAATKFKPELGHRFSTYSSWWIIRNIKQEIERQGIVNYPANVCKNAVTLAKHDYQPDGLDMSTDAFEMARRAFLSNFSLSAPGPEHSVFEYSGDFDVVDKNTPSPDMELITTRQKEFVDFCLSKLEERERAIICARYYDGQTLDAIGKAWDISRERVRQILNIIVRKLAHIKREGAEWANAAG